MPMVAVPNRLLLIVAKKTLLLFAVIIASYFFVTTLMTGIFSSSPSSLNDSPSTSSVADGKNGGEPSVKGVNFIGKNKKKQKEPEKVLPKIDIETNNGNESSTNDDQAETSQYVNYFPGTQLLNLMDGNGGKQNLNGAPLNETDDDGPMDRSFRNKMPPDEFLILPTKMINVPSNNKNKQQMLKKKIRHLVDDDDENSSSPLPLCAEPSPNLTGKIKQAVLLMTTLKESEIISNHGLLVGGQWKPKDCKSRHKVAIIVPFRDRQSHLNRLIEFLIPILQRQLLDFRFIVTEQYGHDLFNKGRIMNAAFEFAENLGVDCVLFHDVDMFPQDDRNFYGCPNEPRHIGAFVNTLGYELWYDYIVGGVLAIQIEHYKQINGYSNMYWAWGGEDDDMGYRILANNLTIERPDPILGRMTMLKHLKRARTAPSLIHELLKTASVRWVTDGLNDTQWNTIKIIKKPLYFHLYVDVGTIPNEWRQEKSSTTTVKPKKT